MADPRGLLVQRAALARLQLIKTDDGYNTDAGVTAELGPVNRTNLDISVAIEFGQEQPQPDSFGKNTGNPQTTSNLKMQVQRTFTIVGTIKSKPADDPKGEQIELLLADIKRAVFNGVPWLGTSNPSLGWPTYAGAQLTPRQEGNQFETLVVNGTTTYTEAIGDPTNG